MQQSQLFTKTRREAPKDEVARNAELLIRGGFVHKEMAGVYALLPLGLRVIKRIENIIREEMNELGGQEVELTALQAPSLWKKTDRWSEENVDAWFKTRLQDGTELGLSFTHEEPLTAILAEYAQSYRDFPVAIYQFQTKFRNELRAKSGLFRGREFLMKDLYSFGRTEEEFREFYEKTAKAYTRIFDRVGVGDMTYRTFASGGSFSEFSDEFQTLTDAGEDTIYLDEEKRTAVNKEVYNNDVLKKLGLDKKNLVKKKSIEVGNIFPLGTKYSKPLGLSYTDEKGNTHPVVMGSYGIGLGRLLATVVETHADERGIVWPESISPFDMHVVILSGEEGKGVRTFAETLCSHLEAEGVSVLIDDRDVSAGEKFADADLIGITKRVVVSTQTVERESVEVKDRATGETRLVDKGALLEKKL